MRGGTGHQNERDPVGNLLEKERGEHLEGIQRRRKRKNNL